MHEVKGKSLAHDNVVQKGKKVWADQAQLKPKFKICQYLVPTVWKHLICLTRKTNTTQLNTAWGEPITNMSRLFVQAISFSLLFNSKREGGRGEPTHQHYLLLTFIWYESLNAMHIMVTPQCCYFWMLPPANSMHLQRHSLVTGRMIFTGQNHLSETGMRK